MNLHTYLAFVAVAAVVVLAPGADFAVVTRKTLAGGRTRGWATASGINVSNLVQGGAAAAGLGAVVVAARPVFLGIEYAGAAYLGWLAVQALRAAVRGRYTHEHDASASGGLRQGFLTNITNPKVLVFYLAVLPQFISPGAPAAALVVLAVTHALLSQAYLCGLVVVLDRARRWLTRTPVRRTLDALTGTALGALSVRLVVD